MQLRASNDHRFAPIIDFEIGKNTRLLDSSLGKNRGFWIIAPETVVQLRASLSNDLRFAPIIDFEIGKKTRFSDSSAKN